MAQQVQLMGAIYNAVPAVMLPDSNNVMHRFDDASITTATASDVASGKVFLASDGTITTGTSSGGGGTNSWTKIAETSYQVSTTNTTVATVATWATGHSELWTSDKIVYVRVRDTAGKRAKYFYGTDTFFTNIRPVNNVSTITDESGGIILNVWVVTTANLYRQRYGYGSSGYGVFPSRFYSDGNIIISSRYHSSYSLTVNGTYSVEVYLLDPPTGAPIFT